MMRTIRGGSIWDYAATHALVVTTNIGWRRDGLNPMGRGVAQQAAGRFPLLPAWYGQYCRLHGAETPTVRAPAPLTGRAQLVLFPTKPLEVARPGMSWAGPATIERIVASAHQLVALASGRTVLPPVGCGNGGLCWADVETILRDVLISDDFLVLLPR